MPLVVVAVAWLAQGAVLRNGWVWDDAVVVRDGRAVAEGLAAVPSMLHGSWARGEGIEVGLFRPLVGVTLAVQAQLHGTADPFLPARRVRHDVGERYRFALIDGACHFPAEERPDAVTAALLAWLGSLPGR